MHVETIICDLCLKDITKVHYIPRIKVKPKPKGGWKFEESGYAAFSGHLELCETCESKIFDVVMSLRVTGANLTIYKEVAEETEKSDGFISLADQYDAVMATLIKEKEEKEKKERKERRERKKQGL